MQAKLFKQSFWMRKFGHWVPKRTTTWSNSQLIGCLQTSRLSKQERGGDNGVKSYRDKRGRRKFHGTAGLKATQPPSCKPSSLANCDVDYTFSETG